MNKPTPTVARTLYVTDLDGTLLDSDQRVSPFSCSVINDLVTRGMIFSYATARSWHSSHRVAAGLEACFPMVGRQPCARLPSALPWQAGVLSTCR